MISGQRMTRREDGDGQHEIRQVPYGFLRPGQRRIRDPAEEVREGHAGLHPIQLRAAFRRWTQERRV